MSQADASFAQRNDSAANAENFKARNGKRYIVTSLYSENSGRPRVVNCLRFGFNAPSSATGGNNDACDASGADMRP